MKPFLFIALLIFAAQCCAPPTIYRIPRRTFDNILHENVEMQNLNARFFLTEGSYMPDVIKNFMFYVLENVRHQVWGAIDIMLAEPKESHECLYYNQDCIKAGLFLFHESCPVIRILYDSGTDPSLYYETAIAERGWKNDTGYIFTYDAGHYMKSNLDLNFQAPLSADVSEEPISFISVMDANVLLTSNSTFACNCP